MTMGMLADDDGFVNSPRAIMRQTGASDDDMKVLIAKKFVIPFDSGVIVIKHWRINNYLRNDRYQETTYIDEKSQLIIDENKAYKRANDVGIPIAVYPDKNSIGKNRLDKNNDIYGPPSLEEVEKFCKERKSSVNPKQFYDYYSETDWKDKDGRPIERWKATLIAWEKNGKQRITYEKPVYEELTSENRNALIEQMGRDKDATKLH